MKSTIGSRRRYLGRRLLSRFRSQEAGASLFQGLRLRLTLWYCVVLVAALALFGIALYLSTSYVLLNQIRTSVARSADDRAHLWAPISSANSNICQFYDRTGQPGPQSSGSQNGQPPAMISGQPVISCFNVNGSVLTADTSTNTPFSLSLLHSLASSALQSKQRQVQTANVGTPYGRTYSYAIPVVNSSSGTVVCVIIASESVETPMELLSLLLEMLLIIGALALVGASVGGLFLSKRALQPAHLAWDNQQRFIADASHELRTPLTLLRADAEVLLRNKGRLSEDDAQLLEDIVQETNHMTHIASSLLTLARLDSKTAHREHDVVDMVVVARKAFQRVRALAEKQRLHFRLSSTVEHAVVVGDSSMLEESLIALLDNAVKYNRPDGTIAMVLTEEQGQIHISVQDSGIGIPSEHLPHLGERFYRVDKARSREAGGTGLGLSIVHGIAQSHHGSLSIQSVMGQGTAVTMHLPLARLSHPTTSVPLQTATH